MSADLAPAIRSVLLEAIPEARIGRVLVIALSGELGGARALRLQRAVDRALRRGEAEIVLDLKQVTGITGSAIATLIRCAAAAQQAGGGIRVARMRLSVRHSLALIGSIHWLSPQRTVAAAVASFGRKAADDG